MRPPFFFFFFSFSFVCLCYSRISLLSALSAQCSSPQTFPSLFIFKLRFSNRHTHTHTLLCYANSSTYVRTRYMYARTRTYVPVSRSREEYSRQVFWSDSPLALWQSVWNTAKTNGTQYCTGMYAGSNYVLNAHTLTEIGREREHFAPFFILQLIFSLSALQSFSPLLSSERLLISFWLYFGAFRLTQSNDGDYVVLAMYCIAKYTRFFLFSSLFVSSFTDASGQDVLKWPVCLSVCQLISLRKSIVFFSSWQINFNCVFRALPAVLPPWDHHQWIEECLGYLGDPFPGPVSGC